MSVLLVEGLPGSGKSTTAHLMARHLDQSGISTRWIYEHETPHPILQYADVVTTLEQGSLREGMFDEGLEQWRNLLNRLGPDETIVLESAFFQIPVHPMLLMDWRPNQIEAYVASVDTMLSNHAPLLVFLRHDDVKTALTEAARLRGAWFAGFLADRIAKVPFGIARGLEGFDGLVTYFTAYRNLLDQLVAKLSTQVLLLDAAGPKTMFTTRISDALGLPPPDAVRTSADATDLIGSYAATGVDDTYRVGFDGEHLILEGDSPTRLLPIGPDVFEVCGTPVCLTFVRDAEGHPERLLCDAPLPNLPREWVRER